jgi:dipeptidyl aminopeptidase/acylaminoacyl peptidase
VDFTGSKKPRELTSGNQGATHNPVFNGDGYKVAWAQLDEDGYEADRLVAETSSPADSDSNCPAQGQGRHIRPKERYLLHTDAALGSIRRGTCCEIRNFIIFRDPGRALNVSQFSQNSTLLYLTAGDHARSKLFVLPIPDTPDKSTTDPSLPPRYVTPKPLTHNGAVTALQILPQGRLIYSRSSLQGPNDVFIIRGLHELETDMANTQGDFKWEVTPEQITRFAEKTLAGKTLGPPEDFYFEGAEGKQVHGFVVKPYGWKEGDKKKWPGLLLIHGGMLALAKPMNIQYTEQLYRSSRGLGRSVVNEVEPKRICTPRVFRCSN